MYETDPSVMNAKDEGQNGKFHNSKPGKNWIRSEGAVGGGSRYAGKRHRRLEQAVFEQNTYHSALQSPVPSP